MKRVLLASFAALLLHACAASRAAPADTTLLGMQVGKSTLQDVLNRFGVAPLRQGDVDELCYRSESPLQATWVVFGAGAAGNYERLTQIRVLSSQPPGMTCPPSYEVKLTR